MAFENDFRDLLRAFSDAYISHNGRPKLLVSSIGSLSAETIDKVWPGPGKCFSITDAARIGGKLCYFVLLRRPTAQDADTADNEFKRLADVGGGRLRQHRIISGGGITGPTLQWCAFLHSQLAGDGSERIDDSAIAYEPFDASIQAINGLLESDQPSQTTSEVVGEEMPTQVATGDEPDAALKATDRKTILESLQPAQRIAYYAYQLAESKAGRKLKDQEAYDRICEVDFSDDTVSWDELADYNLPVFDTWSRQVRSSRERLGEQKNTRRAGRTTGGSVVRQDKI